MTEMIVEHRACKSHTAVFVEKPLASHGLAKNGNIFPIFQFLGV